MPGARSNRVSDRVAAEVALPLTVTFSGHDEVLDGLTPAVADALVGAVCEALRNVSRHASVGEAFVDVRSDHGQVTVTIQDHGRGRVLPAKHGFGITHSIIGRMGAVGGEAVVLSDSAGTRITLRWPYSTMARSQRPSVVDTASSTRLALGAGTTIVWVGIPILVAQVLLAASHIPGDPRPFVHVLVAAAFFLATLATIEVLRSGTLTLAFVIVNAVALPLLAGLSIWVTGPATLAGTACWQAGFAATPLTLLALHLPLRLLPLLALPLPAVVVAVTVASPDVPLAAISGSLLSFVLLLLGGGLGHLIRRYADAQSRAPARLYARDLGQRRMEMMQTARDTHLRYAEAEILPWLRRIADGEVALDQAASARAAILAQEARDDLYVPEFMSDTLRREVGDFRRRGGRVDLRPGLRGGLETAHVEWTVRVLVRHLTPDRRVTVTALADGQVRFVVSPGIGAAWIQALLEPIAPRLVVKGDQFATSFLIPSGP